MSRPLAGGWLGLTAGGRPDTTIILLDRSPSMQQAGSDAARVEARDRACSNWSQRSRRWARRAGC